MEGTREWALGLDGPCSFCGKTASEVTTLCGVEGQPARICAPCVGLCLAIIAAAPSGRSPNREAWQAARREAASGTPDGEARARAALATTGMSELRAVRVVAHLAGRAPAEVVQSLACSFCGAFQAEVARLIAGPQVYVCDQCVADAGARLDHRGDG